MAEQKELSGKIIEGIAYGVDVTPKGELVADISISLPVILIGLAAKSNKSWVKKIAGWAQNFLEKKLPEAGEAQGFAKKHAPEQSETSKEAKTEGLDEAAAEPKSQIEHQPL